MKNGGDREIRFRPSRVEGISDVVEVIVHCDRFEVQTTTQLHVFPFLSFAEYREISSGRVPVGELRFSKSHYSDSHFLFYTTPRIAIYMPVDGPTAYPESHFWRIQKILREGGFKLYEDGPPKRPPSVLNVRWQRTPLYVLVVLTLAWVFGLCGYLPGHAGEAMRHFMLSNPRNPSIGIVFVLPMLAVPIMLAIRHGRTLTGLTWIIVASFFLTRISEFALRWAIEPWARLDEAPFRDRFWSTHQFVTHFIAVSVCAVAGASWRQTCVEPIFDLERREARARILTARHR